MESILAMMLANQNKIETKNDNINQMFRDMIALEELRTKFLQSEIEALKLEIELLKMKLE